MMDTTQPLEVKVVYSSAKHRPGRRARVGRGPVRPSRWMLLGVVNLLAAGAVYYGTCWWADPELRVKLILDMPLPGVDLNAAADILPPSRTEPSDQLARGDGEPGVGDRPSADRRPASTGLSDRTGDTSRAIFFVGTIVGWEILSVLSACALALSGGALFARGGGASVRTAGVVVAFGGLVVLGWQAYELWQRYAGFVPLQQRLDIGGLVLLFALIGLFVARRSRGLTYLAAALLIVSAAGSVFGLCVGRHYEAVNAADLPLPFPFFLVFVFVVHSLWGWILLPLASRVRY